MTSLLDTCDSVVNNERRRALALAPGVGNGATGVYDDDANADAKLTVEVDDDDDDFNPRPSPRPNPNAIALTAHTVITITRLRRCSIVIIPLDNHTAIARAPPLAPCRTRNATYTRERARVDRSRRGSADRVERVAVWPIPRARVRGSTTSPHGISNFDQS